MYDNMQVTTYIKYNNIQGVKSLGEDFMWCSEDIYVALFYMHIDIVYYILECIFKKDQYSEPFESLLSVIISSCNYELFEHVMAKINVDILDQEVINDTILYKQYKMTYKLVKDLFLTDYAIVELIRDKNDETDNILLANSKNYTIFQLKLLAKYGRIDIIKAIALNVQFEYLTKQDMLRNAHPDILDQLQVLLS